MTIGTSLKPSCPYDGLGWFYDRYWADLSRKMMPAVESLVLAHLARGSRILDLCCGTGHLSAVLSRRGFRVIGLDSSADMVAFARQNAPHAEFVVADARALAFEQAFDAVISTGDSMNHFLTVPDLEKVFTRVHSALKPGGILVFDMNMAEAFLKQWHKSSTIVASDHLMYIRGHFDKSERIGQTEVTLFRRSEAWKRQDLTMMQRCYAQRDVKALLSKSGFTRVSARSAASLSIRGRLSVGRTFFQALKP